VRFLSHGRDLAKVAEALKAPITEFGRFLMLSWQTKPMKLQCLRKNWKKTRATVMLIARIDTTKRVSCKMDVRHQVVMTSKSVPRSPDWSLIRVTAQTNNTIRVILVGWQQWLTANEQDAVDAGAGLQKRKKKGKVTMAQENSNTRSRQAIFRDVIADDASRAGS
jgi:hypothetical protein